MHGRDHVYLSIKGEQLTASLDDKHLPVVNDGSIRNGLVTLGTGSNQTLLGNLSIEEA